MPILGLYACGIWSPIASCRCSSRRRAGANRGDCATATMLWRSGSRQVAVRRSRRGSRRCSIMSDKLPSRAFLRPLVRRPASRVRSTPRSDPRGRCSISTARFTDQRRMRAAMAVELLKFALRRPLQRSEHAARPCARIARRRSRCGTVTRASRRERKFDRAAQARDNSRARFDRLVTEWMLAAAAEAPAVRVAPMA